MATETVFIAVDQNWTLLSNSVVAPFKARPTGAYRGDRFTVAFGDTAPAAGSIGGLTSYSIDADTLPGKVWARADSLMFLAVTRTVDAANPAIPKLGTLTLSALAYTTTTAPGTEIGTFGGLGAGDVIESFSPRDGRVVLNAEKTKLLVGLSSSSAEPFTIKVRYGNPKTIPARKEAEFTLNVTLGAGGGVVPTLGPSTAAFTASAASGSLITAITGLQSGETLASVAPNDGRLAVSSTGLLVGLSASSAGTINATVTTSAGRTLAIVLTVNAATGLPSYSASAETAAYIARMATQPNTNRRLALDRMYRQIKRAGALWTKMQATNCGAWILGDPDADAFKVNIFKPGQNDLVATGSPVHATDGTGCSGWGNAVYFSTGIPLNALAPDSCSLGIEYTSYAANDFSDMGAVDGSGAGLSITSNNGTSGIRCYGALSAGAAAGQASDKTSFVSASRSSTAAFDPQYNGADKPTVAQTAAAQFTSALQLLIGKVNGSSNASTKSISFAFVGPALTKHERRHLYGAVRTYLNTVVYGAPLAYESGVGPSNQSFDVVVYGATAMGIIHAYEARRQGLTACIIGGYRERHIGGMSTNGLGFVDFDNPDALGGVPRRVINRSIVIDGSTPAANDVKITSASFKLALQELLDPAKGGYDIPIFWSDGIQSATVSTRRITKATTVDGRVLSGRYWHDASYEGDLLAAAGCSFATGREAASGGTGEQKNGYRGLSTTSGGNIHQYQKGSTFFNISPYNTDGDPASGLLPGIIALPSKTIGQADNETQAFNFRMALSTQASRRQAFDSGIMPSGYDKARYEPLGRWIAAGTAAGTPITLDDIFNIDGIRAGISDMNSDGGTGTDLWGSGTAYVNATSYAARRVVWESVRNHIKGLFYYLGFENDSRIPSALRTAFLGLGFANNHFLDPYFDEDEMFWPFQLYVREDRRLKGDLIMTGDDLLTASGTAMRSTKTIAVISYTPDSHHTQALADTTSTPHRIWMEGNFFAGLGGTNSVVPLFLEAALPKKSEIENLSVSFCYSATHAAFGAIRMEFTAMLGAQALAMLTAVAANDNLPLADANYTAFRDRMLALPDAKVVSLPLAA